MKDHLIADIRKAVIGAGVNLEVECRHRLMADESGCPFGDHYREIRLTDVLLAIQVATKGHGDSWWFVDKYGEFRRMDASDDAAGKWNLAKDNLDDQDLKDLQFIHSLLKT